MYPSVGFRSISSECLTTCFPQTSVSYSTENIHLQVERAVLIFATVIYSVQVLPKILYDGFCIYAMVLAARSRLSGGRKIISFCQEL